MSEFRKLDPETTRRPQVYEAIVEKLYRGDWKESRATVDDAATHVSVLQHIAWLLFKSNPAGWSFHIVKHWVPAVKTARQDMVTMRVVEFRQNLRNTGLMVSTGNGSEAFLHRTFLEYLAAAHVAMNLDPVEVAEEYLWKRDPQTGKLRWQPAAADFLVLLAGCLDNPRPLLERIVQEAAKHPDGLFIMNRLAGRCLTDVRPQSLRRDKLTDGILSRSDEAFVVLGRTTIGVSIGSLS